MGENDNNNENNSHTTDRLLRNAVLITAEALFCLGLASLVASFLLNNGGGGTGDGNNSDKNQNSPNMGMLVGGFAVIICAIAIFGVMLCLKCANTYQSKVQVDVPTANEIAKAYEEFYGNTKSLPPFVAKGTSTVIAGSSLETEETDSRDSNNLKFNPDKIYTSSQEEVTVVNTVGIPTGGSYSVISLDPNNRNKRSDKRSKKSSNYSSYKKPASVSQKDHSTETRRFHQKRSFSTYDSSRQSR